MNLKELISTKTKEKTELKVVGKVDLDKINSLMHPRKKSKEEKAALRQQAKEDKERRNRDATMGLLQKRLEETRQEIERLEERVASLRARDKKADAALAAKRKESTERLAQLERRAAMRERYAASPITNDVRQKELCFMGVRPQKMDVVHFHVPAHGESGDEMDGVALVRDENHYYIAVDMYDREDREDNITTIMDENPDGTFDGIWPRGVVLKPAAKFEERYMRTLADRYGNDLDKAEAFVAHVAEGERLEIEELKEEIASLDEQIGAIGEVEDISDKLMQLRIRRYRTEQDIKALAGDSEDGQEAEPVAHTEEDYEPMEPIDSDTDIELRCPHLPYLRGKRLMTTMNWPVIETGGKPWLRFRLMSNVARLMQILQDVHALTYVLSREYAEEMAHRSASFYAKARMEDVVPAGESFSAAVVMPNKGFEDTVLFNVNNRRQMSIVVVYIREGRLMFYESYSEQSVMSQPRTDVYMCQELREAGTGSERMFSWLRRLIIGFISMERDMERTVKHLVEDGLGSASEASIAEDDAVDITDDRDVAVRDANWYTDITVNRQIPVRGYISHRVCVSNGGKQIKEVWVRPHVRHGYHRGAGVGTEQETE